MERAIETEPTLGGVTVDERGPLIAESVIRGIKRAGIEIATFLPESLLKRTYRAIIDDPGIRYIPVSNEADMPGIVAGAYLGGKRAIMMMENSGLRQACEPIARFWFSHQVPMVMIMALRGGFPEYNWWGHAHTQSMEPILNALRIPYWFVSRIDEIERYITGAWIHADSGQSPVALVFADECTEVPPYAKI